MIGEEPPIIQATITLGQKKYLFHANTPKEMEKKFLMWLAKFMPQEYQKITREKEAQLQILLTPVSNLE